MILTILISSNVFGEGGEGGVNSNSGTMDPMGLTLVCIVYRPYGTDTSLFCMSESIYPYPES